MSTQLQMRRPHLDKLPALALPEGFALRTASEDDLAPLTALLTEAFPELTWNSEKTLSALFRDPTCHTTFIIIAPDGALAATATARLLPDRFPGAGYVHWVGGALAHRGKRLGYSVSLAVLHQFVALACESAVLETDDFRGPAIRVYWALGFVPEISDPSHAERWERLMR